MKKTNLFPYGENAKIVVLGAGESGVGAAILAKKKNYPVFVSDAGAISEIYREELNRLAISFEERKHTIEKILNANLIIKSPGIPDHVPIIKELKEKGIPVISEIEFAAKHTTATLIGITGSNGKTTTTTITHHLLKIAGLNVELGGNIGFSFARLVAADLPKRADNRRKYFVLELSSFQLDGIVDFRPDYAILLNITPDHLDRYDYKMANYVASKFRLIENQQPSDCFIFNQDDENIHSFRDAKAYTQQLVPLKWEDVQSEQLHLGGTHTFDLTNCELKGLHNRFNIACAIHVALQLNIDEQVIQKGLHTLKNVEHRLEWVTTINGVDYINDSKATNVDAVYFALQTMRKPIIWIAGGTDKGNDYTALDEVVEQKVKALICLGVDNRKLVERYSPMLKIVEETNSAEEAVQRASVYAEEGDVVLLSPACASFDLFKNYTKRGDAFKKAVVHLKRKNIL